MVKEQLARVLAAVILIATFAVPSAAWAHEGHGHHRTAVKATAVHIDSAAPAKALTDKSHAPFASVRAAAPRSASAPVPADCGGHCCGTGAGMACCGAALAPTLLDSSIFFACVPFVIRDALPAHGLSPEAPPKPPKSFA